MTVTLPNRSSSCIELSCIVAPIANLSRCPRLCLLIARCSWAFARLGYHPGDMLEVFSDQIIDQARMTQADPYAFRSASDHMRRTRGVRHICGVQRSSCARWKPES